MMSGTGHCGNARLRFQERQHCTLNSFKDFSRISYDQVALILDDHDGCVRLEPQPSKGCITMLETIKALTKLDSL